MDPGSVESEVWSRLVPKQVVLLFQLVVQSVHLTVGGGEKAATPAPAQDLNLDDLRVPHARQETQFTQFTHKCEAVTVSLEPSARARDRGRRAPRC